MTNASVIYRAKALACEKRANETSNYDFKCTWQDLAIEWHALASRAGQEAERHAVEIN